MTDLREMMPHSKPESKMEKKDPVFVINEVILCFMFFVVVVVINLVVCCRSLR